MTGWKTWAALEEVTAANMNSYVRDQTIQTFTNVAARTAAISSPSRGLVSLLTDTGELETYYGATTGWDRPWALPRGIQAYNSTVAGTSAVSTETVCLTSSSFTGVVNRFYKATFTATCLNSVIDALLGVQLRKNSVAGTSYGTYRFPGVGTNTQNPVSMSFYFTGTAGSQTVCATLARIAGTGTVNLLTGLTAQIIVEDLGPISSTAPTA